MGGDLFEVLRVSDDRVVVALGDVCGKGIPSSLFMAVTVTLLRTLARQLDGPGQILTRLNEELAAQNPRAMFVTMACLDIRGGRVTCANAGHDATLLVRKSGGAEPVFASSGTVLGLFPGREYETETLELEDGDSLVLYTDGVTEAWNALDEEYGEARLVDLLVERRTESASGLQAAILGSLEAFAAGAKATDDRTLIVLKREA